MARRAPKRKIEERLSDPGDEGGMFSRAAIGCAIALGAVILIAGVIGIAVGARQRMSAFGGDDDEESDDAPPPVVDPAIATGNGTGNVGGGQPIAPPPNNDDDMRRRYRAGPLVRVDSLVAS